MRTFGKGKCKLIANFSATMVTPLPFSFPFFFASKIDWYKNNSNKMKSKDFHSEIAASHLPKKKKLPLITIAFF